MIESSIERFAKEFDAVYLNGSQVAAHAQLVEAQNLAPVKIDDALIEQLNPDCVILDPQQRTGPLMAENMDARWAGYRQAENGLYVRMALLLTMLAD
jgi:aspartate carbamoyltransferase catalytic subunit